MGMFDTVHFRCPKGHKIEQQSKGAVNPDLQNFDCVHTPIAVAGYILDDKIECEECNIVYIITTNTPHISLLLIEAPKEEEEEDY